MAHDGKMYTSTARKGELFELRTALNANTMKDRKVALKRVVAAMSIGRDMSPLFPDVVKNTVGDLSMKKLVYLYIINYAHANPDLSILIVNTFIKDSADHNPLIRALAIRTMSLVPLDKITEYLCDPLRAALQDRDPYVRKTAAVSVAKLYDTNPTLAVSDGFVSRLQKLLSDGNPMVVANAVAALGEIADATNDHTLLPLNSKTVPRFLSALSECTEWGQIFILDAISSYVPSTSSETDLMAERIIPRLQHANPAVVLAAVRVIVSIMPRLDTEEKRSFIRNKMSAPLITLLKAQPELQFVALRNISLLIQSHPDMLSSDVRVLFASYADPLYVKREKLDVLVQIANDDNCSTLLPELREYAGDVDITFSQKAVDVISRVALRLPSCAPRCVSVLSDLLNRRAQHVTEQIAISVAQICRAYPGRFSALVAQLCESVEDISDTAAKSALVWTIGEHALELRTSVEMLEIIATTIEEESRTVQLEMLTACVKALLARGSEAQAVTNAVIKHATEKSTNFDVRDRGFIYSRLVAAGPELARNVVLGEKPTVSDNQSSMDKDLLRELSKSLSSIASVFHRPPKTFEGLKKKAPVGMPVGDGMAEEDLLGLDADDETSGNKEPNSTTNVGGNDAQKAVVPVGSSLLDDLLGDGPSQPNPAGSRPSPENDGVDLLADLGMGGLAITDGNGKPGDGKAASTNMKLLLVRDKGKGLEVSGDIVRGSRGELRLRFKFANHGQAEMSGFALQVNKNLFGLRMTSPMSVGLPVAPGSSIDTEVSVDTQGDADGSKGVALQMAIKFSPGGVVYFTMDLGNRIEMLFDRVNGGLSKNVYLSTWGKVSDSEEVSADIELDRALAESVEGISAKLSSSGIFTVAKRANAKPRVLYLSARCEGSLNLAILAELSVPVSPGGNSSVAGKIASRCTQSGESGRLVVVEFNKACTRLLG